jgi:murein L,D-transpeptidase YafK
MHQLHIFRSWRQPFGTMKKWTTGTFGLLILIGAVYYLSPEERLSTGQKIDKIVVKKSERRMEVYSGGQLIKSYRISLGRNPKGGKEFEGDKRTPEGHYTINDKNPNSAYHKNLGVSYPNPGDIEEARKRNLNPGGDIKIHGIRNGFGFIGKFQRMLDWTAGCIALTNDEMDELYDRVDIGTPITIEP